MKFGPTPIEEAEGAVLAHGVRIDGAALKKGDILTRERRLALAAAGVTSVVAARLEPGDVGENEAALKLANASRRRAFALLAAVHRARQPVRGDRGACDHRGRGHRSGQCGRRSDHRRDAAAMSRRRRRRHGRDGQDHSVCNSEARRSRPRSRRCAGGAISRPAVQADADRGGLDDAARPEGQRSSRKPCACSRRGSSRRERGSSRQEIVAARDRAARESARQADRRRRCAHCVRRLRDHRPARRHSGRDRGDRGAHRTVRHAGRSRQPAAACRAHGTPIIGAPGCARSPKENGFDWVLQRVLAGVPIRDADIRAMGVGGLLMEIASRPQPRAPDD